MTQLVEKKPKSRNTNHVMEEQPSWYVAKRCEHSDKVTVKIVSFVESKIIQRLVSQEKVFYLTTPWIDYIASMIDGSLVQWYWQGMTKVLGGEMLSCQLLHQKSHMNGTGIEPDPTRRNAGEKPHEPWKSLRMCARACCLFYNVVSKSDYTYVAIWLD